MQREPSKVLSGETAVGGDHQCKLLLGGGGDCCANVALL